MYDSLSIFKPNYDVNLQYSGEYKYLADNSKNKELKYLEKSRSKYNNTAKNK